MVLAQGFPVFIVFAQGFPVFNVFAQRFPVFSVFAQGFPAYWVFALVTRRMFHNLSARKMFVQGRHSHGEPSPALIEA